MNKQEIEVAIQDLRELVGSIDRVGTKKELMAYSYAIECMELVQKIPEVIKEIEDLKAKAEKEVRHGKGILIKEPYTPYIKCLEIIKEKLGGIE